MKDLSDSFAVLGLSPDTDWETLRAHYRRLISQWHPDRFVADAATQKVAEERSKQITAAYKALESYHRDHGVLPPVQPAAVQAAARDSQGSEGDESERDGNLAESHASAEALNGVSPRRRGRRRRIVMTLVVLVAAAYGAQRCIDAPSTSVRQIPQTTGDEPSVAHREGRLSERASAQRGISIGSTFGDVYAIQGIPTRTDGDVWHFGKSRIHFSQGLVVSWDEDPDFPLRIARNQLVQMSDGHFKIGSTKDEVRAIQGTPVTETTTVWDYGLSRVYFEHNRVIRWEDSPIQPLRVQR